MKILNEVWCHVAVVPMSGIVPQLDVLGSHDTHETHALLCEKHALLCETHDCYVKNVVAM